MLAIADLITNLAFAELSIGIYRHRLSGCRHELRQRLAIRRRHGQAEL
jgi:hypothetical protein